MYVKRSQIKPHSYRIPFWKLISEAVLDLKYFILSIDELKIYPLYSRIASSLKSWYFFIEQNKRNDMS